MFNDYTEDERIAFCRAVANVVASDHEVTEDERAELNGLLMATGLSPLDERVEKEVMGELDSPGPIKDILAGFDKPQMSANLFRVLVEVAAADGKIADEERVKIGEAAAAFGLNEDAAMELLDWTLGAIEHEQKEQEILARLS